MEAASPVRRRLVRLAAAFPRRRLLIIGAAGAAGAVIALLASRLLALTTSCNGGCPTATDPTPFVLLLAGVTAWSAYSATRP
jgi:NADPH:quinone reductase-like Zn-dependent oxidoreductase